MTRTLSFFTSLLHALSERSWASGHGETKWGLIDDVGGAASESARLCARLCAIRMDSDWTRSWHSFEPRRSNSVRRVLPCVRRGKWYVNRAETFVLARSSGVAQLALARVAVHAVSTMRRNPMKLVRGTVRMKQPRRSRRVQKRVRCPARTHLCLTTVRGVYATRVARWF